MDDHNEKNQPEQTQETKPAYNVPPIPTRAQPVPPPQVGVIPQAGYTPPPKVGYNPPPVQSQSYNPPPSVQPQSYNPPPPVQPQSYNPPPPVQPQSYNPPPPVQPQSYNPPPPVQPQSYNPPPPVQPQSYNPPPAQEVNTPSYTQTPPPSAAYGYPLAYQTAPVNASKMSKSTLIAIIVTAAVVLILIGVIIYGVVTNDSSGVNLPKSPTTITNPFSGKQNAVNVDVEQVERPALENEMYQNQVTGLLTPEGVFEYVLPSSVLVNVFGDNFFSPIAYGSGVVMSSNGYIITNAHVVDGGESYSITTSDGENYEAEFIGMDSSEDVAVLKINAEGLTPATFGKTEDVKLGESIAIIANASEYLRNFATYGHISNLEQEIITDYGSTLRVFQTDAAVNAGTSGGPAVNMYGQVIGIVVGKQVDPEMNMTESVGFLLRIDTVIDVAEQLIENGYVEGEVKIGITYQPLDNLTASYYDLPSGLLIYSVVEDSGAKAAGIVVNDIITEIDGVPVLSEESIKKALEGKRAGDIVVVSVARKKITGEVEELEMNLTLGQKIDLPSNESYTTTTHEHEEPEE